jgi:hypothetical protein
MDNLLVYKHFLLRMVFCLHSRFPTLTMVVPFSLLTYAGDIIVTKSALFLTVSVSLQIVLTIFAG